ncbi:hypothetical protein M011DRAFT_446990 [Sporormia fimetaria CBS 119925]|uniref:Uncharacterized protein n=1 Tax=Sporormia fimetaria CBS 119925 TaxID=1340428 RepID=A0A6A6V4Z4_9PLEO|nr:hypothetical protein M011DRAFT_446990 [Sporormia fimetaria CBS 119925]
MATTRLRRTFRYPADSDDEDAVEEGMDERDQEELITSLSSHDTSSTKLYTQLLLLLPLLPALLYLPRLFAFRTILPSLAAIASLLASAYTLYFLPLPPVSPSSSTAQHKGKATARDRVTGAKSFSFIPQESQPVPYLSPETADLLRQYMIPVNAALCAILCITELAQRRSWGEGMMIGGGYVPGFVLTFILWARRELRVVDLGELERLRYRTKGG